jgi:hypothetical protein
MGLALYGLVALAQYLLIRSIDAAPATTEF